MGKQNSYIILASSSPRRRRLLSLTGIDFKVEKVNIKENYRKGEKVEDFVKRVSLEKAVKAAKKWPDRWVVAADTVVFIDRCILGKPRNIKEAISMLCKLSGRTHKVFSGVSVVNLNRGYCDIRVEVTDVKFRKFSKIEAIYYARTGEPLDKAGGYGAQGFGLLLIEKVKGSFSNVIGLPLTTLIEMLIKAGAIKIFNLWKNSCGRSNRMQSI